MRAHIFITLKNGVLDPQGQAVAGSLHQLGYSEVEAVRIGKFIEVDLATSSKEEAEKKLAAMCEALLANTVIESYRVEMV
jgi:phosphoribosylformylglycinamidine synthase PurS subunit